MLSQLKCKLHLGSGLVAAVLPGRSSAILGGSPAFVMRGFVKTAVMGAATLACTHRGTPSLGWLSTIGSARKQIKIYSND